MKTRLLIIFGIILLPISVGSVYAECSEQDRDACFDSNGKFDYDAYEDSFWEPVKVQHSFEKNSTATFEHKKEGLGLRGIFTATQEDVVTMTVPRSFVDSIFRNCDPDEIMLLAKYTTRYENTTAHKGFYQESFLADQIMNQTHRVVTLKVLPTMSFEILGSFPLGLVGEMLDTCGAPNGYMTYYAPPKFQLEHGVTFEDMKCNDDLFLIQKYDGSTACVTPVTKQHLIDRGWAKTKSLDEIQGNPDLVKQNIVRIEDGFIALYPENMCASISLELLTEQDIQRYKNDEKGLDDTNILQITSGDLKEIPNIQELIYAVHSIEFPYNKYSSAYLDGSTFVEYEFFLMEKAMKKYGDSQEDYFIKLDKDYEERFTNPAKQGFTNTFEVPVMVYNDNIYSVDGTVFWTSDEHEPMRMGVYPKDSIEKDEKFITLTDEDMRSIPKIKEAIENIGSIKESLSAYKGLPEDQWNEYREWFKQKSQDRLNADWFRLIQYDEWFYPVGFVIC